MLTSLSAGDFASTPQLMYLNISRNSNLTDINANTFSSLTNLEAMCVALCRDALSLTSK